MFDDLIQRADDVLDRIVRTVVTHPNFTEIRRARRRRHKTIEATGGAPVTEPEVMQAVVDLGIEEAEYFDWTPDLLLMSENQYESLFRGPDGTRQPISEKYDLVGGQHRLILPDRENIRVVPCPWLDRMYLIDSKDL